MEEWRKGHEAEPIVIEGEFDDLEDWERNAPGVSGLIYDGKIRLRAVATLEQEGGKPRVVYEAFIPEETISGWADRWRDLDPAIQQLAQAEGTDGAAWRTGANRERVRERIRAEHPEWVTSGEPRWTSDPISIKQALQQAIPKAIFIPAVKDASEEVKPGTKTAFGELLLKVIMPAIVQSEEYQSLLEATRQLRYRLKGDGVGQLEAVRRVEEMISQRLSSLIDAKAMITVDSPDAEKFLGTAMGLRLDDGTNTPVFLQGHGIQRALVFALVEVLAVQEVRNEETGNTRQRSTVLLFEEPELYIHPHLMRRLKRALQTLAESRGWQVVISTHSPFLVNVAEDPRSLIILRRPDRHSPPIVRQLDEDPFEGDDIVKMEREALRAALDFHPTVCEAFFAERTVLVEGDTEVAVLVHQPRLYELCGIPKDKVEGCSIVSCGGKWTIPGMARLLKLFGVPVRVIHDRDARGRSLDELRQAPAIDPYRVNERLAQLMSSDDIFVVEDSFEDLLWSTGERPQSAGDKPYRAWRRVKELCADEGGLGRFPKLRELVEFAFNWVGETEISTGAAGASGTARRAEGV